MYWTKFSRWGCLTVVAFAGLTSSCANVDFSPASVLESVRMLSARADKPYAAPGETVQLEMLTYDGRPNRTRPMQMYWIPITCINPRQDLYYECFRQFAGASVPGGGGGGVTLTPGVDLSPYLPTGSTYSITLPADIISSHPPVQGVDVPYGMAIAFGIACAGHIELVARTDNPQAVPFGCFDENGARLGPDDHVIGLTRVYAYETRRNANPTIATVLLEGQPVDPAVGLVVDRCETELRRDCPDIKIDVVVPPDNQEIQEGSSDPDGRARREQIWAAYYADIGQLDSETRLLYEIFSGKVEGSENKYKASNDIREGLMYVIVHDNRGGASWLKLPVHTREPRRVREPSSLAKPK